MREGESRDYIFNLRKGFLKSPSWKRSKKAVAVLKSLIKRHSKVENVRIGEWLNAEIHKHGAKNPPSKIKINIKIEKLKDEKTKAEALVARAELAELPPRAIRLAKLEEEKKKIKAEAEKKEEKVPKKEEEKKLTKKEERKASKKELLKELAEAKENEEKKKMAKMTAAQEREMHA